jgi:hypothetical protein
MTPAPAPPPTIHEAVCARDGSGGVTRGAVLTADEAIARRQRDEDVVVCGPDPFANAKEARAIESAVGACKHDGPHADVAGALALPHFQQKRPPPFGHTFYEVHPKRKAVTTL